MGRHQARLMRFALRYPEGWHGYGTDKGTTQAVRSLLRLGFLELSPTSRQFRLKLGHRVAPEPATVRHTACTHCGLDIEGIAPFEEGQWRDRGNNPTCPHGDNQGKPHAPVEGG